MTLSTLEVTGLGPEPLKLMTHKLSFHGVKKLYVFSLIAKAN